MKCPNCGTAIKEGSLYCEHCGQDIQIVPDFEPEFEFDIQHTISGIAGEITKEEAESEQISEKFGEILETERVSGRYLRIAAVIGSIFLVLTAAFAGVTVYRYYSPDYQIKRAAQCVKNEQYENAIKHYSRALLLDEGNIETRFALAEAYFSKGNKIEYEYHLTEIVKDENADIEQLQRAYGKLISIYRAREDYSTINELLLTCENHDIQSIYHDYIASEPEFSVQEGDYDSIQPLKLTAHGSGKIYYTMDGSEPNENSRQYTAPIVLDNGVYVITACFVNEKGIYSKSVSRKYHINVDEIPAPEISLLSGEYNFPVLIEVLDEDDENIFYTTDGSMPSYSSTPYVGPIPMPIGNSVFQFAKIEDGRVGNVAECTYELTLNTDFLPEQAVDAVIDYEVKVGKIFDESGWFAYNDDSRYLYEYQYVVNIEDAGDFYVVSEIFKDVDGVLTKTGNHFAVNIYTGSLYKLQKDIDNHFTLLDIEEPQ